MWVTVGSIEKGGSRKRSDKKVKRGRIRIKKHTREIDPRISLLQLGIAVFIVGEPSILVQYSLTFLYNEPNIAARARTPKIAPCKWK